jgi:uncharacterized protein YndB with AHSA1/START domain
MSTTTNRHGSAVVTLPSDTEILITRVFDAPAALLFKAYTTPELVKRWWGFAEDEWVTCEVDLRVGGAWRWVALHNGDFEVGFHGEYLEIDAPHRLVFTEVYEGFPGDETGDGAARNVVIFDEADGVTTMTNLVQHAKREHRDMHIESGMEGGMQISMDRMEDLVRGGL